MKPIELELQAFGPFAARQVIDFRLLGDKTFFLIHGPTGSGKTSILDGICFALFGDSSGGEREGRQLRSHHAEPATLTEASFAFALGERRFRVRRVPEQTRPARRGGGETKQAQTAEIWRLDTAADGSEREQPLAAGWSKVNDTVVELLGFHSAQFRQVIVLPQGRFFEFLKARSDGRESILQRLFGTEIYKRIEEQLKAAAGALEREAGDARARRQGVLDHARATDEAALAQRQQQQTDALKTREGELLAAAGEAEQAERVLALVRQQAAWFAELDAAVAALHALRVREPTVAQQRSQLALARRAALIEPHATALARLRQQADAAMHQCQTSQAELTRALAVAEKADAALSQARAREPEADALVVAIARLDALVGKVQALAAARRAHDEAQAAAAGAAPALEGARQSQRHADQQCQGLAEAIRQHQLLAAALAGREASHRQCSERLGQAKAFAERQAERGQALGDAYAKAKAHRAARHALTRARADRDALRQHWLASQAARLAHELVDGEPCPVCGARDHPVPAAADGEYVTDAMLAAADEALTRAETAQRMAERRHLDARQAIERLDERIGDLRAALGETAIDLPALQAQADAAAAELRAAQAAQAALPALESRRQAAEQAQAAAQQAVAQAENTQREAQGKLQQLAGQVSAHAEGVPADVTEPSVLEQKRRETQAALDKLRRAKADAEREADAAGSARTRAQAQLEAAGKSRAALAEQSVQAGAELDQQLAAADFADIGAYQAARLDRAVMATLEANVHEFDLQRAAASERHARAEQACRDLARPDLPAAIDRHDAAKKAQFGANSAVVEAREALGATALSVGELARIAAQVQAIESRYGVLAQVAEVASGANPLRMSFQRYVLATLLDEVLAATTLRLTAMSRGRYEIRRAAGAGDRRFAAGLDLEVFDHYTGRARGVATLSGGESFVASLALALGLSDVVQSYAGGIRLDAIFVDEGFGTLDAEALDDAVRTLMDLQQAGRLVGIISHVAELKERIDARLELTASAAGSVARFRL